MSFREGLGVVPMQTRQFPRHAPSQADIEGRQALLSVEHCGERRVWHGRKRRAMSVIALVVIEHEAEEVELVAVLRGHLPIEECSEREPLHQAVEESADLLWAPDELPLDRGEYEVALVDLFEGLLNGMAGLVHGGVGLGWAVRGWMLGASQVDGRRSGP